MHINMIHRPQISVVIASVNGLPTISECLSALEGQKGDIPSEVIVVDCCKDGTAEHIKSNFPNVKLISLAERLGIPELRMMGISHAIGEYIAITEDHCIAPDNWFQEIMKAHDLGYEAVGGAVENVCVERILDWAVYLCEYSHVMLPVPRGEVDGIPGNNASIKKALLDKVDETIKKNYWEYFLHEELRKSGVRFFSTPDIVINHKKEFGFLYFLSQRFHYSRSFAGMRRSKLSGFRRLLCVLFSPLLPFLLLFRMGRQVFKKKRHRVVFIKSFPIQAVFMVSYTLGEFVGYLLGPGNSLVKVE